MWSSLICRRGSVCPSRCPSCQLPLHIPVRGSQHIDVPSEPTGAIRSAAGPFAHASLPPGRVFPTPALHPAGFPRAAVTHDHNPAFNSRKVLSCSSGGQKAEIKVSAGPCSLRRLWGRSFFASSGCCWLPAFLGLQLHRLILPLSPHGLLLSVSVCPDFPLLMRTPATGFNLLAEVQQDLISALIGPAKPLFPNKFPFMSSGETGHLGNTHHPHTSYSDSLLLF